MPEVREGEIRQGDSKVSQHGRGLSASRDMFTQSGRSTALLNDTLEDAEVHTVQFGVQAPKDASGNAIPFACVATIAWSNDGNTIRRQVSVKNGQSISAPGRVVNITITDTTPAFLPQAEDTPTPGPGSKYTASCLVNRYPRPGSALPPTLYGPVPFVLGASSFSGYIPIPPDAGVASLEISAVEAVEFPTVKPNVWVSFTTAAGGIFKAYDPTLESGFVAIPDGATGFQVFNADTVNPVLISTNFGIDG